MCFGFNGFGQLDVYREENDGRETSCDLTVAPPRALLELLSPPASVTVSSCWDSLYVHISTEDGNSHSLCTGRWAGSVQDAKKLLEEGEHFMEVVETPQGQLILQTREGRLMLVSSTGGSVEARKFRNKPLEQVTKMSCLGNNGNIYSLLASGVVHECEVDPQSLYLKLSREHPTDGQRVSDIACGGDHCLLLTSAGAVLSFGLGTRGQLGHGDLTSRSDPTLIQALAGVPMRSIACGLWHSLVLSRTGDAYSWGWNRDGQLGLRDPPGTTVTLPSLVDISDSFGGEDVEIVSVSCGSRHSAAVSKAGELLCWGWDGCGQVRGAGSSGCRVHSVYCSHWSTLFIQSDIPTSPAADLQ